MSNLTESQKELRLFEYQDSRFRFDKIANIGREFSSKQPLPDAQFAQPQHIDVMFRLLKEISPYGNPGVLPSWWEHTYAATALAKELSLALNKKGLNTNPNANAVAMVGHDWGRLVIPARQYVNDLVNDSMQKRMGIPQSYRDRMIPTEAILKGAIPFEQLTIEQRITNLADNLGKRTADGTLFDEATCFKYLDEEASRYPDTSHALWNLEKQFIEHRSIAINYQKQILHQTLDWLKQLGINYEDIREKEIPAPSIIYLARHGDTDNKGLVYNLDEYTERPISITDLGRKQMIGLAQLIKGRRIEINNIICSNQLRAKQSAQIIADELTYSDPLSIDSQLRDVDAPALMIPGRFKSMAEFEEKGVPRMYNPENVHYVDPETGKHFDNESLDSLQRRILTEIQHIQKQRRPNGSNHTLVVSHGDPIRAAIAGFERKLEMSTEEYRDIWEQDYLKKGEMWELIFSPDGSYVTRHRFSNNK